MNLRHVFATLKSTAGIAVIALAIIMGVVAAAGSITYISLTDEAECVVDKARSYADGDDIPEECAAYASIGSSGVFGFDFRDVAGAPVNTRISSAPVLVDNFEGEKALSISGPGSPLISVNGGDEVSGPVNVKENDEIIISLISDPLHDTARTVTVVLDGVSETWTVLTGSASTASPPASTINFDDSSLQGVEPSTVNDTPSVTVSGFSGLRAISVSGEGDPYLIINGGTPVKSGFVQDGDEIVIRHTAHADLSTSSSPMVHTVIISYDGGTATVTSTTREIDSTPDPFAFVPDIEDQMALSTQSLSNPAVVTGFDNTLPVTISGSGSPLFDVNGSGSFVSSASIMDGDAIRVQITSPSSSDEINTATVTVGNGAGAETANYSAATGVFGDPEFIAIIDADETTLYESNLVTFTNLPGPSPISLSDANGPEYSIDGGAYSTIDGVNVDNGSTLKLRMISSGTPGDVVVATLSVDGIDANWTITTKLPDISPAGLVLNDQVDVPAYSLICSNSVTLTDFDGALVPSINAPSSSYIYRVNGVDDTDGTTPVVAGDTFQICITSGAPGGETQSAIVTIGDVSEAFQVSTSQSDPDPFTFGTKHFSGDQTLAYRQCLPVSGDPRVYVEGFSGTLPISLSDIGDGNAGPITVSVRGGSHLENNVAQEGDWLEICFNGPLNNEERNIAIQIGNTVGTARAVRQPIPPSSTFGLSDFTPIAGADPDTVYESNGQTISGAPVEGIEVYIDPALLQSALLVNDIVQSSATTTLHNGDEVKLRGTTTDHSAADQVSKLFIVGGSEVNWSVTNRAIDYVPDSFVFDALYNAELLTSHEAVSTWVVSGLENGVSVEINALYVIAPDPSCNCPALVSINGSAFAVGGFIQNGDSVRLRATSSNTPGSSVHVRIHYTPPGETSAMAANWEIRTRSFDDQPDEFVLADLVNQPLDELSVSDSVQINGIDDGTYLGICNACGLDDGSRPLYVSVNDGPFTQLQDPSQDFIQINNGDRIRVAMISSALPNTGKSIAFGFSKNSFTLSELDGFKSWTVTTGEPSSGSNSFGPTALSCEVLHDPNGHDSSYFGSRVDVGWNYIVGADNDFVRFTGSDYELAGNLVIWEHVSASSFTERLTLNDEGALGPVAISPEFAVFQKAVPRAAAGPGPWSDLTALKANTDYTVEIYRRNGTSWSHFQSIVPPSPYSRVAGEDVSASSMDIEGNRLLINWSSATGASASIYIYEFNGVDAFNMVQNVTSFNTAGEGGDLGDNGATLAIPLTYQTQSASQRRVELYRFVPDSSQFIKTTSVFPAQTEDDLGYNPYWGVSIELDGRVLAIGSSKFDNPVDGTLLPSAEPSSNYPGDQNGVVDIYDFDGSEAVFTQRLEVRQDEDDERLGETLALSGETLIAPQYARNSGTCSKAVPSSPEFEECVLFDAYELSSGSFSYAYTIDDTFGYGETYIGSPTYQAENHAINHGPRSMPAIDRKLLAIPYSFADGPASEPLQGQIYACAAGDPSVNLVDQLTFADLVGQPRDQYIRSNALFVSGDLFGPQIISLSNPESRISINDGPWVTSGTVVAGDKIRLLLLSSGSFSGSSATTLTIGNMTTTWTIFTAPDIYSFGDLSDDGFDDVFTLMASDSKPSERVGIDIAMVGDRIVTASTGIFRNTGVSGNKPSWNFEYSNRLIAWKFNGTDYDEVLNAYNLGFFGQVEASEGKIIGFRAVNKSGPGTPTVFVDALSYEVVTFLPDTEGGWVESSVINVDADNDGVEMEYGLIMGYDTVAPHDPDYSSPGQRMPVITLSDDGDYLHIGFHAYATYCDVAHAQAGTRCTYNAGGRFYNWNDSTESWDLSLQYDLPSNEAVHVNHNMVFTGYDNEALVIVGENSRVYKHDGDKVWYFKGMYGNATLTRPTEFMINGGAPGYHFGTTSFFKDIETNGEWEWPADSKVHGHDIVHECVNNGYSPDGNGQVYNETCFRFLAGGLGGNSHAIMAQIRPETYNGTNLTDIREHGFGRRFDADGDYLVNVEVDLDAVCEGRDGYFGAQSINGTSYGEILFDKHQAITTEVLTPYEERFIMEKGRCQRLFVFKASNRTATTWPLLKEVTLVAPGMSYEADHLYPYARFIAIDNNTIAISDRSLDAPDDSFATDRGGIWVYR